jgi:zinc/manganese transport system permease protein
MNYDGLDITILGPALLAGLLVLSTHVPLGREVLSRGIIFIDLAIAQVAGVGVIAATMMEFESAFAVQAAAVGSAVLAAVLLTWTEKQFPQIQEALIGVLFALGATGSILLLANNPHGGEELKDLLVGQILWVNLGSLVYVAILYAAVLAVWFGVGRKRIGHAGFYLLFAVAVTASVQLVGVYLVFASLIIPALPTRAIKGQCGLVISLAVGILGYVLGLLLSALFDLPTGAVIVWTLALLGVIAAPLVSRRLAVSPAAEPRSEYSGT